MYLIFALIACSVLISIWSNYRLGYYSKKRIKARSRFSLGAIFLLIALAAMAARVYLEYRDYEKLLNYTALSRSIIEWHDHKDMKVQSLVSEEELVAWQRQHELLSEFESAIVKTTNVLTTGFDVYSKTIVPSANPDFASLAFVPCVTLEGSSALFKLNAQQPLNLILEFVDRDDKTVSSQFVVSEIASKNEVEWTLSTQSSTQSATKSNISTTLQEEGKADNLQFKLLAGLHSFRITEEHTLTNPTAKTERDLQCQLTLLIDGNTAIKGLLPPNTGSFFEPISEPGSILEITSADELPTFLNIDCKSSKRARYQLRFRLEAGQ